ncbi:MAG: DUF58 domain-containing protein [Gemmatimonadaceae bacterium]
MAPPRADAGYGALLDALRGVTWTARRPVRGAAAGTHRSPLRGVSPEFTEYRPYRQGDDPRRLDWRLLARTDRAYLRITSDRATIGTLIVVDASASMAFPGDSLGKWRQACRLAVGLAAVAHASADPVGLTVAGPQGIVGLAPRTRRGVVAEIARVLDAVTPGGSAPVADAIAHAPQARRVAVISDFLGDAAETLRAARERATAGGEAYAIHVVARRELEPGPAAAIAVDPERDSVRRPLVPATREAYVLAFADFRDAIAREWTSAGESYAMVTDDEPADRALRRIVSASRAAEHADGATA